MSKSTIEISKIFLDFFYNNGHKIISGSSLIPKNDQSILFTNSGMNQFKDVFLGLDTCNYSRAATLQPCLRAGGKDNDLENVGYTARHHSYFEMLGNFSFGDYFKYEAIKYAWELLTDKKWFNLPKERLWITVYKNDSETYKIWRKIGVPSEHIIYIGDKKDLPYSSDNFWQMGTNGPCGPCTEIFYDHGSHILGTLPGNNKNTGDRYVEIWNIVFIQFNKHSDGTMEPLFKPFIDTGMGLERIAAVLQNVNSNYDIDLFRKLITSIAQILSINDTNNQSLRVIADHIRSSVFLIAEGLVPSNSEHGYVLRSIIRRAIRHGNLLGVKDTFFYKLVEPLIEAMILSSKYLKNQKDKIEQVLKTEEEQFLGTLMRGLGILNKEISKLSNNTLDGSTLFKLYDTYGIPVELTIDVCRAHNIKINKLGFDFAVKKQRNQARQSSKIKPYYNEIICINKISEFKGYDNFKLSSNIIAIFVNKKPVNSIKSGEEAIIILNTTPFYAESGGQVGDRGELKNFNSKFLVNDTQKYSRAIGHIGKLIDGTLSIGDYVKAKVDKTNRIRICLNHSTTHLLHSALRLILGKHIIQKGSLVNDKILRFDFSHFKPLTQSEIIAIEDLVNEQIRLNIPIEINIMSLEEAKKRGALALFENKYEQYVRVLNIGDFSIELCCGTHVLRTGDIGLFYIISESGISNGIRRIEALTGEGAISGLHKQTNLLNQISYILKANKQNLEEKVLNVLNRNKALEEKNQLLKKRIIVYESNNLEKKVLKINGVNLLISVLNNIESQMLRPIINYLKNKIKNAIIVLATIDNNKVSIIVWTSNEILCQVNPRDLISMLVQKVGGKWGGRLNLMQSGGGEGITMLPTALANAKDWIISRL